MVAFLLAATQLFASSDRPAKKGKNGRMAEQISISNPVNTRERGDTLGSVEISVSGGPAPEDIIVNFTLSGTAVMGTDFFGAGWNGVTTIIAGQTSVRIPLEAIDDNLLEGDETVIVTLTGANGLSGGSYTIDNSADTETILIRDNDNEITALGVTGNQAQEPDLPIKARFSLPGGLTAIEDITIYYTAVPITAEPEDFEAPSGQIVLPAGANSVVLTIPVIDDKTIEGNETVKITLTHATSANINYTISNVNSVSSSILDDDSELSISVNGTIHGQEFPNKSGRFTITLPPEVTTESLLTVKYIVTGSATSGLDFTPLSGTAYISANKGSVNVIIPILNDNVIEDLEDIKITLISGSSKDLGSFAISPTDGTTAVNITDDDNIDANRQINAIRVADGGESEGDGSFKLGLPGLYSFKQDMLVTYTVSGTATPGSDYTTLTGNATLVAGQNSVLVTVPVLNDALIEGDESVIITPQAVTAGGDSFTAGDQDTVMIIDDDDDNLKVAVSTFDRHGSEAGDTASFRVTLPNGNAASTPVTVTYTIAGTAENGTDVVLLPGTITIPADSSGAFIPVSPLDDNLVEGNEVLSIKLTGATSTLPFSIDQTSDTASVTILDDDNINMDVVVGVSVPVGAEPAASAEFTVSLASGKITSVPVTVTYTTGGTAVSGSDYTALSDTVTIPAGSTTATISVPVLDDDLIEGDETVSITLTDVTADLPFVKGLPDTDTVIINDDDDVDMSVVINASVPNAAEPGTPGEFTVSLASGKTTLVPITVTYTVSGTATAVEDYTPLSGAITIPANSSGAKFAVPVVNDTIAETNETVIVQLNTVTATQPFVKGTPDRDTVIIIDDDTEQLVITAGDPDAGEPSDAGQFTVRIVSGKPAAADITVDLQITGSATNGTDYTTIPASMVIPEGNSSITIPVSVLDDDLIEGNETVAVKLMKLTSAVLYNIGGNDNDTVTIDDDDDANLKVEIVATKADAAEPGTDPGNEGEFTIRLESGKTPIQDVTIDYTIGGSALNGTDYDLIPSKAVIPAGSSSVTIPIQVKDDPKPEGMESIILTMTKVAGDKPFTMGLNSYATVNILDNDTVLTAAWMSAHHDRPTVSAGDRISYVIHISNGSDTDYVNVVVQDRVPEYTVFVLGEGGVRPDASGLITWTIPMIARGTTVTLELQVRVANDLTGADTIVNTATVNFGDALGDQPVRPADPLDPNQPLQNADPNQPSSEIPVNTSGGFITWKTVKTSNNAPIVKTGEELLYRIYIRNTGGISLQNVSIVDTIPVNTVYVSNATGGIYDALTNTISWTRPTVGVGVKDSVSFIVKVADDVAGATEIVNQATVATADSTARTSPCESGVGGCSGAAGPTIMPMEQGPGPVSELVFPNVFTPNGDGLNEYFKVRGLETYTGGAELYIYNRWGNQVYASKDYKNDWNGNGLNEGTYYYLLRVKTSSEETKSYKGWVELLR